MYSKISHPCTELCVDVKTLLCKDYRTREGKAYTGVLYRMSQDYFLFREVPANPVPPRRNPRVYSGDHITITRSPQGEVRLHFRTPDSDIIKQAGFYAAQVAAEIIDGLVGLEQEVEASAE